MAYNCFDKFAILESLTEQSREPTTNCQIMLPVPGGPGGPIVPYYERPEENIIAASSSRLGNFDSLSFIVYYYLDHKDSHFIIILVISIIIFLYIEIFSVKMIKNSLSFLYLDRRPRSPPPAYSEF